MATAPSPKKRIIVDAQVHLWKASSPDWPWVPGRKPQLSEPFTTEKLYQVVTPLLGAPPKVRGQRANDRLPYRDRTRQSS